MAAGISIREAARRIGIDEAAVRRAIKAGKLSVSLLPDGSLNPETVVGDYNSSVDLSKVRSSRKTPLVPLSNFQALKTTKIALDVQMAKQELAQARGELIDKREAQKAVRMLMRTFRNAMLDFSSRYGSVIAAKTGCDAPLLIGVLEAQMREALNELAAHQLPFEAGGNDDG